MQCFFYGTIRDENKDKGPNGVVSFTIPDLGIVFRAQFKGKAQECEYASLLALLEFIEINPHLFRNKTVEIFGDSFVVVNQVNLQMFCNKELEPYRNMALVYKKKIAYSLNWIPQNENPAQNELTFR
jgi:ribonuclease HI